MFALLKGSQWIIITIHFTNSVSTTNNSGSTGVPSFTEYTLDEAWQTTWGLTYINKKEQLPTQKTKAMSGMTVYFTT